MDHVKLLELEMLLRFQEVGGIIVHSDFNNKIFSDDYQKWYSIWQGLQREGYSDYGQYFINNADFAVGAYGVTPG